MKIVFSIFLQFCMITICNSQLINNLMSGWTSNYDEAKERAKRENKLLFVEFNWLPDLNSMSEERAFGTGIITQTQKVPVHWSRIVSPSELSGKLVCVKIPENKEMLLTNKYSKYFGAYIILDAFENEFLNPNEFKSGISLAQAIQMLPSNVSILYDLLLRINQHQDSTELILMIADQYQKCYGFGPSNKYYQKLLKINSVKRDKKLTGHIKSNMGLNYYLLGDNDEARDLLEECVKEFPETADRSKQLFILTKINIVENDIDEAKKWLSILRKEFADNQFTKLAESLFETK